MSHSIVKRRGVKIPRYKCLRLRDGAQITQTHLISLVYLKQIDNQNKSNSVNLQRNEPCRSGTLL